MTVITLQNPPFGTPIENTPLPYRQCATLPRKLISKKGAKHFIFISKLYCFHLLQTLAVIFYIT